MNETMTSETLGRERNADPRNGSWRTNRSPEWMNTTREGEANVTHVLGEKKKRLVGGQEGNRQDKSIRKEQTRHAEWTIKPMAR